jgi:hypothetical protein
MLLVGILLQKVILESKLKILNLKTNYIRILKIAFLTMMALSIKMEKLGHEK